MKGIGELIVGFILICLFVATLTWDAIPFIWIGALISGIITCLSGIYHLLTSEGGPQAPLIPPPPPEMGLPPPPPQSRECSRCGFLNKKGVPTCKRCGNQL